MNKQNRKISLLDYLITVFVVIFFSIVYSYAYIIWPREEKFKDVDRARMERIDAAEQLYYSLTNDYTEDGRLLFALMEAIKDTLYGDSLFEGEKDILLAQSLKKYIIEKEGDAKDSLFINTSVEKSFRFSEGVKLFSNHSIQNMNLSEDFKSNEILGQVRKQIITNLISHTSPKLKDDSIEYSVDIGNNTFKYSMRYYNDFVDKKIYVQKSKIDSSLGLSTDVFYKSMLDDKVLYNENDFEISKVSVNIPLGFKNRLDTTFTKPIKIEHFYEDSIYAVKILNFDPTENFEDLNSNGTWDFGEKYFDIVYVNSKSLVDYQGEYFKDSNNNGIWDSSEKYKDQNYNGKWDQGEYFEDINNNKVWDQAEEYRDINNNGQYDEKKISYLGIIPDQDIIYSVKLKDQDSVIHVPSYYYKKLSKKNKIEEVLSEQKIDHKIVKRKMIWMDYLTKSDTLSSDSLFSSINFFKKGYNKKELFNIKVTRFDNPQVLFYSDELTSSEISKDIYDSKETFSFKAPFSKDEIKSDLYVEKLDPPNIIISSPVPKNENWRYWQNINLVSIDNITSGQYSKSSFSMPTPFSFYTGDHGKIVNHVKSWIDE